MEKSILNKYLFGIFFFQEKCYRTSNTVIAISGIWEKEIFIFPEESAPGEKYSTVYLWEVFIKKLLSIFLCQRME